jgi:hypothetical protein
LPGLKPSAPVCETAAPSRVHYCAFGYIHPIPLPHTSDKITKTGLRNCYFCRHSAVQHIMNSGGRCAEEICFVCHFRRFACERRFTRAGR